MSGRIDDPSDASSEMWPEDAEGLVSKFGELALSFLGLAFTPAAVLKILKDQFLSANRIGRIKYLFNGKWRESSRSLSQSTRIYATK